MFGLSFGELCVLVVVAIVVIGPKDLPKVLRKAGQFAAKLRRMASDVRAQSGIDDVLRNEGLTGDLAEIRRLAQGDFNNIMPHKTPDQLEEEGLVVVREREYPREGPDTYGALPDHAIAYAGSLPPSPHALDALYMKGDANAKLDPPKVVLPMTEPKTHEPSSEGDAKVEAATSPTTPQAPLP